MLELSTLKFAPVSTTPTTTPRKSRNPSTRTPISLAHHDQFEESVRALQGRLDGLLSAQRAACTGQTSQSEVIDLAMVRADLPRAMRELADLLNRRLSVLRQHSMQLMGEREDAHEREERARALSSSLDTDGPQDSHPSGRLDDEAKLNQQLLEVEEQREALRRELDAVETRRKSLKRELAEVRRARARSQEDARKELNDIHTKPTLEDIASEITKCQKGIERVEQEATALDEGAIIVDDVMAELSELETQLCQILAAGESPDDLLDKAIASLEVKITDVDANGWTLLQVSLRSELEGLMAAKELLSQRRALTSASKGKQRETSSNS
ncbi:hypothetical protein PYCC9005_001360 [Savitreella phatthalungensis]